MFFMRFPNVYKTRARIPNYPWCVPQRTLLQFRHRCSRRNFQLKLLRIEGLIQGELNHFEHNTVLLLRPLDFNQ